MIPEGTYRAVAIAQPDGAYAMWGETKKGDPQVLMTFEVLNVEGQADYAGEHIDWRGHFTEKTKKRTVESLRLCGFTGDDLSKTLAQPLIREVDIVIKHDEYNGKVSAQINWINAPGSGTKMAKPMNFAALTKLSASMAGEVARIAEPSKPLPGPTDDDLDL